MVGLRKNKVFVFDNSQNKENGFKGVLKSLLWPFFNLFYHVLLFFFKPTDFSPNSPKYNISICAIFKNEARFIREWIEYHKLIGVEHFYLYNNFSDDNYKEILEEYINNNLITLIDWPIPQGQFSAYENWFKTYRHETQWVSFLDLDEFICPIYETNLSKWINKYNKYPCVVLYWKMFGTSGHIDHDFEKLVTEQYIVSWDRMYTVGKVLYNTKFEIAEFNAGVHHNTISLIKMFGCKFRIPPINEFKYFIKWNINYIGNKSLSDFTIQINHYWSKSYGQYVLKTNKGDVAYINTPKTKAFFLWHENHNKCVDYNIYRFIIQLKESFFFNKNTKFDNEK